MPGVRTKNEPWAIVRGEAARPAMGILLTWKEHAETADGLSHRITAAMRPPRLPALGSGGGGDMCKRNSESQSAGLHNFEENERQNSAISIETANDIIAAVRSARKEEIPGPERLKRANCPLTWGRPSIFIGFFLQMIASQQQRTYLKAYRA